MVENFDVLGTSSDRRVRVTRVKDRSYTFNPVQIARQSTDDILIYKKIYEVMLVRQCRRNLVLHVRPHERYRTCRPHPPASLRQIQRLQWRRRADGGL